MGRAYEVKNFIKEEVLFRDLEKKNIHWRYKSNKYLTRPSKNSDFKGFPYIVINYSDYIVLQYFNDEVVDYNLNNKKHKPDYFISDSLYNNIKEYAIKSNMNKYKNTDVEMPKAVSDWANNIPTKESVIARLDAIFEMVYNGNDVFACVNNEEVK